MKKIIVAIATGAAIAILLFSACSKPDPFGADLLQDLQEDYFYTDALRFSCTLEKEDSVITADPTSAAGFFLCGEMQDPTFGYSKSEIFTLFQLSTLGVSFDDYHLDSVVLYLAYDKAGLYGDSTLAHTVEVWRLQDTMDNARLYNSNETRAVDPSGLIGSVQFTPSNVKSASLIDSSITSQTGRDSAYGSYLRIPLDMNFGQDIMDLDSTTLSSDASFWKEIKGLQIRTNTSSAPSMMGFDLNNSSLSRITLFYNRGDTIHRSFHLYFKGNNKFTHFEHNYAGSAVENLIGKPTNDLIYLQGISGLRTRIQVFNADTLTNVAINKAEIIFTAPANPTKFAMSDQLVVNEYLTDTTYSLISDVLFSLGPSLANGFTKFGGQPKEETVNSASVTRYHCALSQYFQGVVDGSKTGVFYLAPYPQIADPSRLVLYGPDHPDFPAKIAVKYTKLP